jgi:glycine/D-amino acid oxidase-like deaminating enzyme
MHVVIRRWTNAAALVDAMQAREEEVTGLIQGVPGFVAYYATRDGDTMTTVTVCQAREGTQESTRRAGEWVRQNLAGAAITAPEVTEGETFLQF